MMTAGIMMAVNTAGGTNFSDLASQLGKLSLPAKANMIKRMPKVMINMPKIKSASFIINLTHKKLVC